MVPAPLSLMTRPCYLFLSTVQIHSAGLGSAVPSASMALTMKVCLPSERRLMFPGDAHP
jgi:hypothetical protein